jgi:phosphatidylserine/phosphatidylglycerophosphate/cardiolipin synthase-like enzyme
MRANYLRFKRQRRPLTFEDDQSFQRRLEETEKWQSASCEGRAGIIHYPRSVPMHDVMKQQREARRKIIRQWTRLPKDRRQSMEEISEFVRTAARQNVFVRSRRDPYEQIMGWLLPRADQL